MRYFRYYHGEDHTIIGTTKQQIIDLFNYYTERNKDKPDRCILKIPTKGEISELEKISIGVVSPMTSNKWVNIRIDEKIVVKVNAADADYVKETVADLEKHKRADLYALNGFHHVYHLPRNIMEGLRRYYWGRHKQMVRKAKLQRQEALDELREAQS